MGDCHSHRGSRGIACDFPACSERFFPKSKSTMPWPAVRHRARINGWQVSPAQVLPTDDLCTAHKSPATHPPTGPISEGAEGPVPHSTKRALDWIEKEHPEVRAKFFTEGRRQGLEEAAKGLNSDEVVEAVARELFRERYKRPPWPDDEPDFARTAALREPAHRILDAICALLEKQ